MPGADVTINIRAKDDGASGTVTRIKGALGGLGGAAKTAGIGLGIATVGVGALAVAGFNFVKAAAEEQAGIARLDQAIRNVGGAMDENIAKSKEAVKAGERLAFSDDETRSGLALLVAQTGDYDEAQRRLRVAMDLSRGAHIDFETAAKLTGKITEENVQVLKRYGITLREGATEQDALAEIQKKFGGQAEAFAKTGAGGWQRFNNEVQNVKESIGTGLLPLFTMASTALADFMAAHQEDIERISVLLGVRLAGALQAVVNFAIEHRGTIDAFFGAFRDGLDTLRPVVEYILTNKIALIIALSAIGLAVAAALGPVSAAALAIVGFIALLGLIRQHQTELKQWIDINNLDMVNSFQNRFGRIGAVVAGIILFMKIYVVDQLTALRDIARIIMALLQGDWSGAWDAMKDFVRGRIETIKAMVALGLEVIRAGFGDLPGKILAALGNLDNLLFDAGKRLIQGFIDGIKSIPVPNPLDLVPGGGIVKGAIGAATGLIPGHAMGGIVAGPIGAPMLIRAHGGEEVRTVAQQRAAANPGAITIHQEFHLDADTSDATMRKMAKLMKDELMDGLQRSGFGGSRILTGAFTPG